MTTPIHKREGLTLNLTDSRWMQTFSGEQVWPLVPEGTIRFIDIAHALSNICRFGGHTKSFYSVAQHSVYASHMVPPDHAKWALLHDAAEAYLGDAIRPLKNSLEVFNPDMRSWESFSDHEEQLLKHIGERFGLQWPPPFEAIEDADLRLLISERRALLQPSPAPWGIFSDMTPGELADLESRTVPIMPLSPMEAKQEFCRRAIQIGLVGMDEAFPVPR